MASIDGSFDAVREQLYELVRTAASEPESWGEGVTLSIGCFRPRPYDAVRIAEVRGIENLRGVGRHHLIVEFEDIVPDGNWLKGVALPALQFLEEVDAKKPRISIDRGA